MKSTTDFKTTMVATVAGTAVGVFVLHPFSMAMYHTMLSSETRTGMSAMPMLLGLDAFSGHMLLMAVFYAVLGGLFGLTVGLLLLRGRELLSVKLEKQHHEAVRQLIEEMTLTVTHYVRNANSAVGGYSRLALKSSKDEKTSERLRVVIESSTQIDAVMAALQGIDESIEREEIGTTHMRMLNIRSQIDSFKNRTPQYN